MKHITRLILALLLVSLTMFFAACNDTPRNQEHNTDDTSQNSTTPDETTNTIEPEDPLKEQKQAVKDEVLALMAEDDRQDPTELFDYFCGDYTISYLSPDNDFGASMNRIYQKDGVTVMEYKDGRTTYSLLRNGYQFNLVTQKGQTDVTAVTPADYTPSIFSDFGIDISQIYSGTDSDSDTEEPILTADMLTVSDDLLTCTFSDAYMKEVTDMLLTSMGYSQDEKIDFLKTYSGSGTYNAQEHSVVFVIRGTEKTLGDITITVSHSDSEEEGYKMSTKMEYTIKADGISIPTSNELIVSDVKYDGNPPVSARFESRVLEQNAKIISDGVTYTMNTSNISVFSLDRKSPILNVDISQQSDTTVMGQTVTQTAHVSLNLKLASLSYISAQDGTYTSEVYGENVFFSAPEDAEIPQIVYDLADKAYYDLVQ